MNPLEAVEIARRQMTLFFIVDTSGSMNGEKIAAVNTAIREVLPEIADISSENADAQIKVACLQFASDVQWLFRPTDVDNLWGDPTKAKTVLGWNPQETSYEELVNIMAKHDRELAKREKAMKEAK